MLMLVALGCKTRSLSLWVTLTIRRQTRCLPVTGVPTTTCLWTCHGRSLIIIISSHFPCSSSTTRPRWTPHATTRTISTHKCWAHFDSGLSRVFRIGPNVVVIVCISEVYAFRVKYENVSIRRVKKRPSVGVILTIYAVQEWDQQNISVILQCGGRWNLRRPYTCMGNFGMRFDAANPISVCYACWMAFNYSHSSSVDKGSLLDGNSQRDGN